MKTFSSSFLDEMRYLADPPADSIIEEIMASSSSNKKELWKFMTDQESDEREAPKALESFIYNQLPEFEVLPEWVDLDLVKSSEELFLSHTQDFFILLGAYSLPYCYAAANGAKVLFHSGRMKNDAVKRLKETGQFVFRVMEPNAFTGIGLGFISCLKVRLLHAAIRYQIKQTNRWDNNKLGIPINQEDMAGTNLAFSFIVSEGLKKLGYKISKHEESALLHRWKLIGFFLGVDLNIIPEGAKEAFFLRTNIEKRHFKASEEGKSLTKQLLFEFENAPEQKFPEGFPTALVHYMVGDEVASLLGLSEPNWTSNLIYINKVLNRAKSNFDAFRYLNIARYDAVKKELLNS